MSMEPYLTHYAPACEPHSVSLKSNQTSVSLISLSLLAHSSLHGSLGAMIGGSAVEMERKVRVVEVSLRCLVCVLGALAAALVATDAQTRTFFTMQKKARFTDLKALVFLVAANAAAAAYSLLQLAARLCLCALCSAAAAPQLGRRRALAWSVFSCDQALAYVTMAAAAAALQASVVSKRGVPAFQWMEVCGLYGAFCRRAGGGVASAVAAGLAAALLAALSAFNLFRLYGKSSGATRGGAATNGATW